MPKTRAKRSPVQPTPQANRLTALAGQPWLPEPAIWLALILSVFVVYAQVGHFDFINYDDDLYVYNNVHVQAGLTAASVKWALTAVVSSNWMPVTLISHILDGQFFHMQSGMHHLVNVAFHMLAAVLLFVALRRATRARAASAFAAFVFALHPLHVESVAWVAERKDVLSACFFFLALYAYVRYTEKPGLGRYLAVLLPFCLGLMSKPMVVTFPFVLLLFDKWPLRRVRWPKILWEKTPMFALSAGACVVTYWVQRSTGAVQAIPFATQAENAMVSYLTYIRQMFWPTRLAMPYPYAQSVAAWQAALAAIVVLGVSALAIYLWRTRPDAAPYLTTGWFWYLGMLVPVIGLVQVGTQSHADRYTYLPTIGLSVIVAWGAADVVAKWPRVKPVVVGLAVVSCGACMALASAQAASWQNIETLYQHAIDVTDNNWVAQYNLGQYLMDKPGRGADAIPHFEAALRIKPNDVKTNNNLGACLLDHGRAAEAIPRFEAVLRAEPDIAEAHFNLALALSQTLGRASDAVPQFETALRLKPDYATAHHHLAILLLRLGRNEEAIAHLEATVRLSPDYLSEYNLGAALSTMQGRKSDAIAHLEAAQRIRPEPNVAEAIERLRTERQDRR